MTSPQKPHARAARADVALVALVVAAGLVARLAWLDSIPGVNADEAWVAGNWLRGHVAWRSISGNVLSPFQFGPFVAAHWLFPSTPLALRLPSALSGAALLVAGALGLRRVLGATAALVFVALAAASPHLIVCARLGWDPSGTPLASLAVVAFAVARMWKSAAAAFVAALVVHPTNALLAPMVLALALVDVAALPAPRRNRWLAGLAVLSAAASAAVLLGLRFRVGAVTQGGAVLARLVDPRGWLWALAALSDLVTGVTSMRYTAGPISTGVAALHALVFWGFALPVVAAGGRRLARRGERRPLALAAGIVASVLALYVGYGRLPLSPGYERYAQAAVVPVLVVVAWCASALAESLGARRVVLAAAAVAALGLASTALNFFEPHLARGGDRVHDTFRSGDVDVRVTVARVLVADGAPARRATVLAEDWWLTMPLYYFLGPTPGARMMQFYPNHVDGALVAEALRSGGYVVAWVGGPLARGLEAQFARVPLRRWVVRDRGGRALVGVWRVEVARGPRGEALVTRPR